MERPWDEEQTPEWEPPPEFEPTPDESEWRGDVHLEDWPENLAGPEYWLYKNEQDSE